MNRSTVRSAAITVPPRLANALTLALIAAYGAAVIVADLTFWPNRTATILLAVPILVVATWKSPEFVILASAMMVGCDVIDIALEHPPLPMWLVTLVALVCIGFLAIFLALKRAEALERNRRQAEQIRTVETLRQPITVILGYAQLLLGQPNLPTSIGPPLQRIETATRRLARQIDDLLAERLPPSP
jgi:signal transduction histidine kinase